MQCKCGLNDIIRHRQETRSMEHMMNEYKLKFHEDRDKQNITVTVLLPPQRRDLLPWQDGQKKGGRKGDWEEYEVVVKGRKRGSLITRVVMMEGGATGRSGILLATTLERYALPTSW